MSELSAWFPYEWRPYQKNSFNAISRAYLKDKVNELLVVQATGTGKRSGAVQISNVPIFHDKPSLFLAHREELINQAVVDFEKCHGFTNVGVIKGKRFEVDKKIVVASPQTLINRLDKIDPDYFGLVQIDECHNYLAKTYLKVVRHFNHKLRIGWTATPWRLDNLSLSNLFEKTVYEYNLDDAIRDGYLCELDAIKVQTHVELKGIHKSMGDFNQKELEEKVDTPQRNNLIAVKYKEYALGRQFVAFCVTKKHAHNLADKFKLHGLNVAVLTSDTEDRNWIDKALREKKLDGVINVNILTEGWDYSEIGCVDLETEILSPNGWKKYNEDFDEAITYNILNKNIEIKKVKAKCLIERNESITLKGSCYDMNITNDHRMLLGTGRRTSGYKIMEASEMKNHNRFRLPISGNSIQNKDINLSDDELRFIAWFITDGGYSRPRTVQISQAKPITTIHIDKLLTRLGYVYSVHTTNNNKGLSKGNAYPLNSFRIAKGDRSSGWKDIKEYLVKEIHPYLLNMSVRQFDIFWNELLLGDGTFPKKKNPLLFTANDKFVDNIQLLATKCGYNINARKEILDSGINFYRLFLRKNKFIEIKRTGSKSYDPIVLNTHKNKQFWCIQNDNGTIITRRNGKVSITGNCVIDASPTTSLTRYLQRIGRGTRLKSKEFVEKFGQNCIILDIIDNTGKHNVINTWELDRGKKASEKTFVTSEKREKLLEAEAARERKFKANVQKDTRINLLKLPKVEISGSPKMLDPATPAQIQFLKNLGIYDEEVEYTKALASEAISNNPAQSWQIRKLKEWGYDVSNGVSIGQFQRVKQKIEYDARFNVDPKEIDKAIKKFGT